MATVHDKIKPLDNLFIIVVDPPDSEKPFGKCGSLSNFKWMSHSVSAVDGAFYD